MFVLLPFPQECTWPRRPFSRNFLEPTEGPELLLRKLRGEHIDWQAMHDGPKSRCQECKELNSWDVFAPRAVGAAPSQPRRPVP